MCAFPGYRANCPYRVTGQSRLAGYPGGGAFPAVSDLAGPSAELAGQIWVSGRVIRDWALSAYSYSAHVIAQLIFGSLRFNTWLGKVLLLAYTTLQEQHGYWSNRGDCPPAPQPVLGYK